MLSYKFQKTEADDEYDSFAVADFTKKSQIETDEYDEQ